jgi:hypothetical protein
MRTYIEQSSEFEHNRKIIMRKFAVEYQDFEFLQQAAAQLPWWHNRALREFGVTLTL